MYSEAQETHCVRGQIIFQSSAKPTYQYQERQLVKLVRVIECKERASCIHMSVKGGGKNIENGEWINRDIGVLSTGI